MDIMNKIIGVALGLFIAAIIMPVALQTLANANVTDVDATVVTVLQVLLPILAVVGIALYFLPKMSRD